MRLETIHTVVAEDGYVLKHRVWSSEVSRATIVLFNGAVSHAGWFFPLVEPLTNAGFALVGADRRGTGLNDVARGDAPSAGTLVEDSVRIIEAHRGEGPLVLFAWCWGAALALNVVPRVAPSAVILAAPGLFPSRQIEERPEAASAEVKGRPDDAPCVEPPITDEMFTSGPHLNGFIRTDDLKLKHLTPRFMKVMRKLGIGAAARLRRLDLPLLVLLADADVATDNDAVLGALGRLGGQHVELVRVDAGHGMHFDAPDAVANAIVSFVSRKVVG